MLKRIAAALWGNFESKQELKKFVFLATIFGLIIGVYWTLRPIKDSAFGSIVGGDYLPYAKILSACVTFVIVLVYAKLVDAFPRHKVFYGIVSTYAFLAGLFAWFFMDPSIGFLNTVTSPDRWIGWAFYVWVETFGSLIVALFWAITTDITAPESAKRGFPIIAMFGQIGNICGPKFLNTRVLGLVHSGPVVGVCSALMFLIVGIFFMFMNSSANDADGHDGYHEGEKTAESEPGFFEGLKLLLSHGYLLGLFFIVSVFELVMTILDNHFKQAVYKEFLTEGTRSAYLSDYAVWVGIIATICIVFGINNITRYIGIGMSLVLTPLLVGLAVLWIKFNPLSIESAFWIMAFSKAVNYALNGPSLKLLYIPTSKDTKYKAQSWIEMFGSRVAKGSASGVNVFRPMFLAKYGPVEGLVAFLTFTSIVSCGLIAVWLFVALYAARTYNQAIKENRIVC